MAQFETVKEAFDSYHKDVESWLSTNKLTDLKSFSDLQDKQIIGSCYRDDQLYFEKVSGYKAKMFSVKSYLVKMKSNSTDRILLRKVDSLLAYVDENIKRMDTLINAAKQRVKFYESVIYLVSNMSYGDY